MPSLKNIIYVDFKIKPADREKKLAKELAPEVQLLHMDEVIEKGRLTPVDFTPPKANRSAYPTDSIPNRGGYRARLAMRELPCSTLRIVRLLDTLIAAFPTCTHTLASRVQISETKDAALRAKIQEVLRAKKQR